MIEELPPYLIPVIVIVSEVAVPSSLSSKMRSKIESIVLDFNKTLRSCQANIDDISLYLPNQHEFFRFIDLGVLISREFATVNQSCDSTIQEKASSCILELSVLRTQALTKKDSEGIDLLISKLGDAPENVFFVEGQEKHIAAGELIGKTI